MEEMLLANRWQCPDGTILESKNRWDFVEHTDALTGKDYFVDGSLQ